MPPGVLGKLHGGGAATNLRMEIDWVRVSTHRSIEGCLREERH
jgi:hypothetical protein